MQGGADSCRPGRVAEAMMIGDGGLQMRQNALKEGDGAAESVDKVKVGDGVADAANCCENILQVCI